MATSKENLFNILDTAEAKKKQWDAGVTFNRLNEVPLDKYSVFKTYAEASAYALTGAISYPGQTLAVIGDLSTDLYFIDTDGSLKPIATGGSTSAVVSVVLSALSDEISARKAADEYISGVVDNLSTGLSTELSALELSVGQISTAIDLSVDNLQKSLSVTVMSVDPVGDAYATYVVKQGGLSVGEYINIPKDKVIESAYMVAVTGEPSSATSATLTAFTVKYDTTIAHILSDDTGTTKIGDNDPTITTFANGTYASIKNAYFGKEGKDGPYLRITVSNQDCPIYIAMPKLVDTYFGGTTTTITVGVSESHEITAKVNDGSIDTAQLSSNAVTEAKIADSAVTEAKIADSAVTNSKIANKSVTLEKLSNDISNWISAVSATTLISANDYTAKLSTSLSTDIKNLSTALSTDIKNLSTSLSNCVDGKFDDLTNTYLPNNYQAKGNYVTSDVAEVATTENKLVVKSTVSSMLTAALDPLDGEYTTGDQQRVKKITQSDGKINVQFETMHLSNIANAYVDLTVALSDAYDPKGSAAQALTAAKAYTDSSIAALDVDQITSYVSATISSISETDGKITATYAPIQIAESQVTNLPTDLQNLSNMISAIGDGQLSNYLEKATFKQISNDTGLSAAKPEDKVAISSHVSAAISAAIGKLTWEKPEEFEPTCTIKVITQEDGQISVVSQEIQIEESQVTQLTDDLDFLSGTLSVVSSDLYELSGSVATISADHETRITANEDAIKLLSSATHFRGTLMSSEIPQSALTSELSVEYGLVNKFKPCEKGDIAIYVTDSTEYIYASDLSAETSGWVKLGDEGTYLKKSEYYVDKAKVELSVAGLSSGLAQEILDRKANDSFLSAAIDNKITVDGVKPTDLSVQHISQADYHALVVAGTALSNCIYIVSSDNYDMYGQQIKNLAEATDLSDAVPKHQAESIAATAASNLSASLSAIQQIKLNDNLFDVEYVNGKLVASLSIDLIDGNF